MVGRMDPDALLNGLNGSLVRDWEEHRRQAFNPNTKGAAYETALKNFLNGYFGDIYNIQTRTAVIDEYLNCFDIFNSGDAELDVVATFKQAVPQIIFESGDMKWVPYDGVSFVCEVKSELTSTSLEDDLEKLAKLDSLREDDRNRRFPRFAGRTELYVEPEKGEKGESIDASVTDQLKCLVYDQASISESTLREKLNVDTNIWDLLLIVDENILFTSPELPFSKLWNSPNRVSYSWIPEDHMEYVLPNIPSLPDGLVWFILTISMSIPRPQPFDTTAALINLVQRNWGDEFGGYEGYARLSD